MPTPPISAVPVTPPFSTEGFDLTFLQKIKNWAGCEQALDLQQCVTDLAQLVSGANLARYSGTGPLLASAFPERGWQDHFIGEEGTDKVLHYVTSKHWDDNRETVVLIPGIPECWYAYRDYIDWFDTVQNKNVIVMDPRGLNASGKPTEAFKYNVLFMQNDIARVMKDAGVTKVDLVGHDIGAALAATYAMLHPGNVSSLTLLGMPHPAVYADAMKQRRLPEYAELIKTMVDERAALNWYTSLQHNLFGNVNPQDYFMELGVFLANNPERVLQFYNANLGPHAFKPPFYPNIQNVPTMVLLAEGDPFLKGHELTGSDGYVDGYFEEHIMSGGHFFHEENPDAVKDKINSFYSNL